MNKYINKNIYKMSKYLDKECYYCKKKNWNELYYMPYCIEYGNLLGMKSIVMCFDDALIIKSSDEYYCSRISDKRYSYTYPEFPMEGKRKSYKECKKGCTIIVIKVLNMIPSSQFSVFPKDIVNIIVDLMLMSK